MATNFKDLIGKVVSFQLYPSAIVTDDFTNCKIIAVGSHESASGFISPARLHSTIYATLPEGTPNDYRAYEYVLIKKQDNTITAVGIPWVKDNSVVIVGSIELHATIRNKTIEDIDLLRKVLMENNFSDIDITISGANA
jgi:hypothetical protein